MYQADSGPQAPSSEAYDQVYVDDFIWSLSIEPVTIAAILLDADRRGHGLDHLGRSIIDALVEVSASRGQADTFARSALLEDIDDVMARWGYHVIASDRSLIEMAKCSRYCSLDPNDDDFILHVLESLAAIDREGYVADWLSKRVIRQAGLERMAVQDRAHDIMVMRRDIGAFVYCNKAS